MECFAMGTFHFSFDCALPGGARSLGHSQPQAPEAPVDTHEQKQHILSSETAQSDTTTTIPTLAPASPEPLEEDAAAAQQEQQEEEKMEISLHGHSAAPAVPPASPMGAEQEQSDGPLSASPACATHTSFTWTRRPFTFSGVLDLVRGRSSPRHYTSVPTTTTTASVCPTMLRYWQSQHTPGDHNGQVQRQHRRLMGSTIALTGDLKFVQCDTPSCSILSEPWIAAPIDAAFVVCAECGSVTVARASNTRYPMEELAWCAEEELQQGERGRGSGSRSSMGVAAADCVRRILARIEVCLDG